MIKALRTVGRYIILMGRVFARPERMRMFFRQYINEIEQLGVNSIGIVLLISFFHRSRYYHTNQAEHRKPFHATLDGGVCHPRNYVAGILILHHVSDIGRQSRLEHRFRTWNDAGYPANRRLLRLWVSTLPIT